MELEGRCSGAAKHAALAAGAFSFSSTVTFLCRSAVRRREDRVVTDYQRHAREVDRRLAERGYEGGVADYLATFIRDKRLRGVVFGSFKKAALKCVMVAVNPG